MAAQGLSPEAIQKLATDIGSNIAQSLGQSLAPQFKWTCSGTFNCGTQFDCDRFHGVVEAAPRVGGE